MHSLFVLAAGLLAALSPAVNAAPSAHTVHHKHRALAAHNVTHAKRQAVSRKQWDSGSYGESFTRYRNRFRRLACASQLDSPFYNECCYPLAQNEALESRPSYCIPTGPACVPHPPEDTPGPSPPAPEPQPEPEQPQPQPPSNNVNWGGYATFYYQNGNPGACGEWSSDWANICAIDQSRYGYNFGVRSSECDRVVRITNTNNGRSVDCVIKDVCPTCTNGNSIDMSYGAFLSIAQEWEGMVPISWYYL